MDNIIIRKIKLEDVIDIQQNCFNRNTVEEVRIRVIENIRKQELGESFQCVAVVNDKVVGTMKIDIQKHPLFAHRCELSDVVVNLNYQRKGIARKLFEFCIEECKKKSLEFIIVAVRGREPAEEVYKHLGFIEYGCLKNGIKETWSNNKYFDMVFLVYKL